VGYCEGQRGLEYRQDKGRTTRYVVREVRSHHPWDGTTQSTQTQKKKQTNKRKKGNEGTEGRKADTLELTTCQRGLPAQQDTPQTNTHAHT